MKELRRARMRLLCKFRTIIPRKGRVSGMEAKGKLGIKILAQKIIKKLVAQVRIMVTTRMEVTKVVKVERRDLTRVTSNVTIVKSLASLQMSVDQRMCHKKMRQRWLSNKMVKKQLC
jgi:hypothetical protein